MQDIHSIGSGGGGGGRLFGGSVGDRRLRPHHHHHHNQGHGPQALKCPRCESLNTKFCYYNNYNLSQPRHFCKSCRRYWTKGGVLRNVPVGGGCRKTKRSKSKTSSRTASERKTSNSQNSSSDSSSLTANTPAVNTPAVNTIVERSNAAVPVAAAEAVSGVNPARSRSTLINFHETVTELFPNPSFSPTLLETSSGGNGNSLFPEIGTFSNLINSSTSNMFNIPADISPFRLHHAGNVLESSNHNQEQWMQTDQSIGDELKVKENENRSLGFTTEFSSGLPEKSCDVGLGTEDWNNGTDQALFDLTGTVDQSYWNQTQWEDHHDDDENNHNHGRDLMDYLP